MKKSIGIKMFLILSATSAMFYWGYHGKKSIPSYLPLSYFSQSGQEDLSLLSGPEEPSSGPSQPDQALSKNKSVAIVSNSTVINSVLNHKEISKGVQILNSYLKQYPESLKEPLFSFIISATIIDNDEAWIEQKLMIEKSIQNMGNSEVQTIKDLYDPKEDSFINQRLLETVYKSSADRLVKIDFLVSRWFDIDEDFEGQQKLASQETITNSIVLLSQIKPEVKMNEFKLAIKNNSKKLSSKKKTILNESLSVYLPALSPMIVSFL